MLDVQAPLLQGFVRVPFPAAEAFYSDKHRDVFAFAGVRGGKSYTGAEKFAARIVRSITDAIRARVDWIPLGPLPMVGKDHPRETYWIVAPTYDLVRLSWTMFRSVVDRVRPLILAEIDGAIWLKTGILVERRTGFDEAQLQGAGLAGAWLDEIATIPHASYLQVRNRLSDRRGWLLGTGSPRPESWARSVLWERRDVLSDAGVHRWTTADNPHFPREELERMKAELPERWLKRDLYASWDVFAGSVYDEFDLALHVVSPDAIPTTDMRWFGGQDWGVAAPGAFILFGQHTPTGRVYAVEEVYSDRLPVYDEHGDDSWVDRVKAVHERRKMKAIYCDVSDGQGDIFHYRKAGLPAAMAWKGKGSVGDGIKTVARLLHPSSTTGEPILRISSACKNLIREIRAYTYVVSPEGVVMDRLDPGASDHALDAARYALHGEFGRAGAGFGVAPVPATMGSPDTWTRAQWNDYSARNAALQRRIRNRF